MLSYQEIRQLEFEERKLSWNWDIPWKIVKVNSYDSKGKCSIIEYVTKSGKCGLSILGKEKPLPMKVYNIYDSFSNIDLGSIKSTVVIEYEVKLEEEEDDYNDEMSYNTYYVTSDGVSGREVADGFVAIENYSSFVKWILSRLTKEEQDSLGDYYIKLING
jgi:hypothetical protein